MPDTRPSAGKRSAKADTPSRCTTSSTTADTPAGHNVAPLTAAQQTAYLRLLAKGASPTAACESLRLDVTAIQVTIETDATFRDQWHRVNQILSQNVAAALYRAAMEGKVPAQTFLLRNRPPPEWQSGDQAPMTRDDLRKLTDDQLEELLRRTAPPPA